MEEVEAEVEDRHDHGDQTMTNEEVKHSPMKKNLSRREQNKIKKAEDAAKEA